MLTIYRIASNTFKECLREPVYFFMLLTALVMIGLFPYVAMFAFGEFMKLVIDSAMATTMLFGLFAAILCAARTINVEMKTGVLLLLMSKPVTRMQLISSKVIGIILALTVFVFICASASFASVMMAEDDMETDTISFLLYTGAIFVSAFFGGTMNFASRKSFSANAIASLAVLMPVAAVIIFLKKTGGALYSLDHDVIIAPERLIPALLLLFPSVWLMGIIASALATRFDLVSNLLICLVIFVSGLMMRYFAITTFGDGAASSLISAVLPNWQLFWMADALANKANIPFSYLAWSFVYFLLFAAAWMIWAAFLFQDSEPAKDTR